MQALSIVSSMTFMLTTLAAVFIFWKATQKSKLFLLVTISWLMLQLFISLTGFYKVTNTAPPRFILLILPPVLFIVILFLTKSGRSFMDGLNIRWLTILHTIRIPVEIVLFMLLLQKLIPGTMTFEGRNPDILSGITAPLVYYFMFVKTSVNTKLLIAWNIICLGLLFNIVTIAILSAPFSFQRFGFDQPNIGLLSFPFVWLPCCVVPLVLFSHLVSLRQLLFKTDRQFDTRSLAQP